MSSWSYLPLGPLLTGAGLVFFHSLFKVTLAISKVIWKDGDIKRSIRLDCCNKLVSAMFAIITCCVGLKVLSYCHTQCSLGIMRCQSDLVRQYLSFGLSYFLYDLRGMFSVFEEEGVESSEKSESVYARFWRKRFVMILHHLVLPFIGFPLIMSYDGGLGDCLLATAFLMEASTPFVSCRAILANLNMKSSLLYLINGFLLLIVFFICRILIFPYLYFLYAKELGKSPVFTLMYEVPIICNVFVTTLILPQLYWFTLIIRGAVKVIGEKIDGQKKNKTA